MSEEDQKLNAGRKTAEVAGDIFKGGARNASRFDIKFNTSRSTAVSIIDNAAKTAKGKPKAWIRYDRPHAGADFNHINVDRVTSKRFHGIKKAPNHVPISAGHMQAVQTVSHVLDGINKVAVPVAIILDTVAIGSSVAQDVKNGSTRNTVTTAATVAGGWGGGIGGATAGASIGTAILPGIGTLIGGLIGGIFGGVGGSVGANVAVNAVADEANYDVEERECEDCGETFKAHVYNGEKDLKKCENCR
uniref:Gly-zipper_Omp domain-containing protein n=1 Tax=Panagrellus redivivus TaxID=6233 RepID=A0A7E4VW09_PANRE